MDFIGKYNLTNKDLLKLNKITFSKENFSISTNKKGYNKENISIFIYGKITDLFSEEYKLIEYKKNQEELILKLYQKVGESFIELLEGYFIIFLYDNKSKTFFIFNNRYSNTYCYYYLTASGIIFADNLSKLLALQPKKTEINMDIVNLFLNSGYSFYEKTYFKDIYRMIPGFFLKCQHGKIIHKRYSGMDFNRKPIKDINKALETYETLWVDAIKKYTDYNDTKGLGSALSGGLDTSWVVLTASKAFKKPIHTYNCYFEYSLFNETKYAEYVSKKCKCKFKKIKVTPKDLDLWPELIRATEEPVLASSIIIYKMMKEARKDSDTFLTGDGGNNIYHHLYPVSEVKKYIHFMPHFIRYLVYKLVDFLAKTSRWQRIWELKYVLHAFYYKNYYENFYKNLTCYRHFNLEERKKLFKPQFQKEINEKEQIGYIPIRKKTFDDDLINNRFVHGNMEYVTTFHEKFAKKLDMKVFPPYQNKKIMDFLCSLPYNLLYRGNTFQKLTNKANKMFFQKLALKKHFPEKFVNKGGQPFDMPYHGWLERRPELVKILFNKLKKRGWYNNEYLDQLYNEHKKQFQHKKVFCYLENHGYRIMALLSLEIWCIEFLDNNSNRKLKKVPLEQYLREN